MRKIVHCIIVGVVFVALSVILYIDRQQVAWATFQVERKFTRQGSVDIIGWPRATNEEVTVHFWLTTNETTTRCWADVKKPSGEVVIRQY